MTPLGHVSSRPGERNSHIHRNGTTDPFSTLPQWEEGSEECDSSC